MTVNHDVAGSSPAGGANRGNVSKHVTPFLLEFMPVSRSEMDDEVSQGGNSNVINLHSKFIAYGPLAQLVRATGS